MPYNEDTRTIPQIQRDNRTHHIMDLISKGYSIRSIHTIIEKQYDMTNAATRNKAIKDALLELSDAFDIEAIKQTNRERLETIYERTQINGERNDKLALDVIEMINKTVGVYEANKTKEAPVAENMNLTIKFD